MSGTQRPPAAVPQRAATPGATGGGRWPAGVGGLPRALAAVSNAINDLYGNQVRQRTATVVAVTGSTLSISLVGTQIDGVSQIDHGVTIAVGDTVVVLQTPGQLIVAGRIKP